MTLRVLHVGKRLPPYPGGIEYFMGDLLAAQQRNGIEVGAIVHQPRAGLATQRDEFHGCPVWQVRTFGQTLYAPIAPTFPAVLRRVVRRWRPNVLHLHMPNVSALAALLPGVVERVPIVTHWHSDVVASRIDRRLAAAYRLYRPFEQTLLRRSAAIIATSEPYLQSSEPLRRWRPKAHVVPLGIDPDRLPMPDEAMRKWASRCWPARMLRVLSVGRHTYYKGHTVLLDALARTPNVALQLVGGGDLHQPLREQATRLGLYDRVGLPGHLSDRHVRGLLAECDCLCLPSIEKTEAFGLVLLEAMRYGKALIVSNIPGSGVGWVCEHEQNGLLCKVGDAASLAAAIQRVRDDRPLLERLGAEGARRFQKRFHIDTVAARLRSVYEDIAPSA